MVQPEPSEEGSQPAAVHVLVADDREDSLHSMQALLSGGEEQVVAVRSGEEALKFLLGHDCAVVLLDVRMPGMDGFETAELIRANHRHATTPIIFVTGVSDSDDQIHRGYALGAVDYIFKPVVPQILQSKVAVFAELFRHRQHSIRQLERELALERELRAGLAPHANAERTRPLPQISGRLMEPIRTEHRAIAQAWIEARSSGAPLPHERVRALAERLAAASAGAKEVIELHAELIHDLNHNLPPSRASALAQRCRILTLELMGSLCERYRLGVSAPQVER